MAEQYSLPDPISYIWGGASGLSYQELKRRREIAAILAARQRKAPSNLGEGLTYLGESIADRFESQRLNEMERAQEAKEKGLVGGAPEDTYSPGGSTPPPAVTLPPPPPPPDPSLTQPRLRPGDVPVQNAPQKPALLQQLPGAQGALQGVPQPDADTLFNPARAQDQPLLQPAAPAVPPVPPVPAAGAPGPGSSLGYPGPAGPAGAVPSSRDAITATLAQRSLGAPLGAGIGVDGGGGGGGGPIYPPTASLGGAGPVSDASSPGASPVPPTAFAQNRTRTVPMTSSDMPTAPLGQTLPPIVPRQAPDMPPSREAIPPATEQDYPDPGPQPQAPGLLGPSRSMQYWQGIAQNPNVSPETRAVANQKMQAENAYREEIQRRQHSEYINQRESWEQKSRGREEWQRKAPERRLDQLVKRLTVEEAMAKAANRPVEAELLSTQLGKARADLEKMRYEAGEPRELELRRGRALTETAEQAAAQGKAPPREKIGDRILERQPDGAWKDVSPNEPLSNLKLTEAQARTLKFFERATLAREQGGSFSAMAGFTDTARGKVPIAGNYLTSPEYQSQDNASEAWIEATLRDASGATIKIEEYPAQKKIYFPQPGDSPQLMRDKETRRENAERSLLDSLGTAKPIADKFLEEHRTKKEAALPEGTVQTNPKTGKTRIKRGGQWEYPNGQ